MLHADHLDAARRQHGLVTRAQLLTTMSVRQVDRLVASGALESLHRGVYRIAGVPDSWLQRVHAAQLMAGPDSFASFGCAGACWGFDGFSRGQVEITVPSRRRARIPGVVVHDTSTLGPIHVGVVDRIRVSSAARTICDLSWHLPVDRIGRLLDDALRRRLTTMRSFVSVADALDGQGRRRCTVTRLVLERRLPGYEPGDSEPEAALARALVAAGLPEPVRQHRIVTPSGTFRVDLAYPDLMIAIEYDGWRFHSSRSSFDRDRSRGNELELLGWTLLRFTSASSLARCVEIVCRAIDQADGRSVA